MKGVNKAIIVGTLGQDPDVKYGSNGGAIVNISVATNESWKDKQGQQQEKTEWHRVSVFGKLAEIAAKYLKKGSQVYLEGRIQTRKWQGQDGQDRYTTEIVANEMQMLGSSGSSDNRNSSSQAQRNEPQQSQPDDGFDDIPFNNPYKSIWRMV